MSSGLIIELFFKVTDILSDILLIEILTERTGNSQMIRDIIINILIGKWCLLPGVVS